MTTKMLSIHLFCFWQVGMLGVGHGTCSTCCCLLQVVCAFPMFTFCFSRDVVPFWSARSTVPFFFLFFSDTLWLKIASMSFVFQISIKNDWAFLGTLEVITRFAIQLGAFAATTCFLSGSPSSRNNCACREYFETTHDVFDNLFLDFVTCSWICRSTCATCVSLHNGNTSGIVLRL